MRSLRNGGTIGAITALAVLAGCSTTGGQTQDASVVVSSYPLEFLASEIGGGDVEVSNVVPAGAEPHDIELSPSDVARMERAQVTFFVGGFQPAIDAATDQLTNTVDLAPALDLEHRGGVLDPHFWLDPGRMITAAQEIESALSAADETNAGQYQERLASLEETLGELDTAFREGLTGCDYDSFVTGHAAFGYLADAYGLTEIAVAGIDPDTEPSPAALAATREEVRRLGLPMVFSEPGDSKIADVLAGELGIGSDILNPVEAVGAGEDYESIMYENLDALKGGLGCR